MKLQAAVELGRLGGLKGGPARAESLCAQRRSEIAKIAAEARWGNCKYAALRARYKEQVKALELKISILDEILSA